MLIASLCCAAPSHASQLPNPLQKKDFHPVDAQKVKIGQLLFYDPILSGNRNISCGTCHNPDFGTGDGFSLGIGEGGKGVGKTRTAGTGGDRIKKRVPRNAQGLWNLGAKEVSVLFHDGRLSVSDIYQNGYNSPAQEWLPKGLETILAAQALFPLTAQFEMAGNPKENEVIGAVHDRIDNAWPILAKRVRTNPAYAKMFVAAFADIDSALDIDIVHIGNALGQFMNFEWQSFDSPFDAYLNGNKTALSTDQLAGMELFYGEANCSSCHSGPLLSDQEFHALALPHFGPGRTRQFDPYARDVGRMGETDRLEDAYRFRTPPLRNVELTAPYGHNGAYPTLEGIIRHHLKPDTSFKTWDRDLAQLPKVPWLANVDFIAFSDRAERSRLSSKIDIEPKNLNDDEIQQLASFLKALTGSKSIEGRLGRPTHVPSGLPVDR